MTPSLTSSAAAPLILLVDTTIAGVAMALARPASASAGQPLLWHAAHHASAGSVPAISLLLTQGLTAVGARIDELGGVGISAGPGSFTGIKIGLAFVYGLSRAANVRTGRPLPVASLSAVEAAATWFAAEMGGHYGLFLPATRTHGFFAVQASLAGGNRAGSGGSRSQLIDVADRSALAAALATLPSTARLAVAGRWPLACEALQALGRSALEVAPSEVSRAAIYGMSDETARLWPAGFGETLPEPRYLRLSTAEERLRGGVS